MILTEAGEALKRLLLKDETREESEEDEEQDQTSMSAEHWASVSHPGYEKPHFIPRSDTDSSHKVPAAEQTILAAVAASIIYSATGMSRWGLAELTLGLYKVYCRHTRERVIDTIDGHLLTSTKELQDISHYLEWSLAAYQETTDLIAKQLKVEENVIIKHNLVAAFGQPSYFIGLNHPKKVVVLSIRGTNSALDVLTDLKPHNEAFGDGYAHSGMLNSAKWLQETNLETLKKLMEQNKYRLVVTGHSLGAGAASLLTMLLRNTDENGLTALGVGPESITCWVYGCPPCVDKRTAMQAKFIKTVVHQDDIVARIGPAALEDLRSEIVGTEWSHALEDGTTRRKIAELAQSSVTVIDRLEPALNLEKGELVKVVQNKSWSTIAYFGNGLEQTWNKVVEGAYGPMYGQAASVLGKGVMLAADHITTVHQTAKLRINDAINDQLRLINQDRKEATVTASSMAAEAAVPSVKEGRALLEQNRSYVPGILYHVIRRPLTAEEKPSENEKIKKCSSETRAYKCLVIRGDNPSSRFKRIVISRTMISDHTLVTLKNSLANYDKMGT